MRNGKSAEIQFQHKRPCLIIGHDGNIRAHGGGAMSAETRLRRLEELRRLDAWLLALTPFQRWQAAIIGALLVNIPNALLMGFLPGSPMVWLQTGGLQ